jgi:hypothetical protein
MTKTGKKTLDMRHVSFRMPADVHQDYVAVAQSRGVDLSALLNWVLIEYWPVLLSKRADHGAAMLRAVGANLPQLTDPGPDTQELIARFDGLAAQLQEVASKLLRHVGAERKQSAA